MNDIKLPNKKIRAVALLALLVGIVSLAMADDALVLAESVNASSTNWSYVNDTFLKLSGGTMTGDIDMDINNIIFDDNLLITTFIGQASIPFSVGKYIMWDNPNGRIRIHNNNNDVDIGSTSTTFSNGIINTVLNINENICTNSAKAFISCGNQSGYVNDTFNTKVNKSGDTMTGLLYIYNTNLTAYQVFRIDSDTLPQIIFRSGTDIQTYRPIIYYGHSRGNTSNPLNSSVGDYLGDFYFQGYNSVNNWRSGSSFGSIQTSINGTTNQIGSNLYFSTKPASQNDNIPTQRMVISETGNITVSDLSGSGNAAVCVDSVGKLYRGGPGC